MNSAVSPPSSGLVAGKYQLLQLIGKGGMGSVWEGRHVSLGTGVAIKFIEKEYADSKEARSRFDNEARAAATIQSKHAIQILDHGVTDDGRPYIVMELLQGEPLDKRLERVRRLSLQETSRILSQVCRALQRAHDGGIVHRDLKPENIFLVRGPDDDEDVAKVLDFGIAKIKGPNGQTLSNSTKTGAVLGTPYYMSPEQARGLREVDHRTDLWSLGVIVFKCVTGVLPFDGESLGDLLVKICTTQVPVPSHVLPGLPPAFDQWFIRSLEREPSKRFSTAQEMADALAYACGVSVRRPSSTSTPDVRGSDPRISGLPATTPSPGTPAPGMVTPGMMTPGMMTPGAGYAGNVTSGPFATSSSVPRVGKKSPVAAGLVVILALGMGVGSAIFFLGKRPPVTAGVASGAGDLLVNSAGAAASVAAPVSAAPPAVPPPVASEAAPVVNVNKLPVSLHGGKANGKAPRGSTHAGAGEPLAAPPPPPPPTPPPPSGKLPKSTDQAGY